jgi:hypothetical protein
MGIEWSRPRPGRFTTGMRLGTHSTGAWVCSKEGLDGCGKSPPAGFDRPARNELLYRLRSRGTFI